MLKISDREIIDVVRYDDVKAILVEKMPLLEDGKYKVNYFVINFDTGAKEAITKNAYLLKKFGSNFQKISESVLNFVQCDAAILPDRSVLVMYSNGQAGVFDNNGDFANDYTVEYNGATASGIADDGEMFWTCCSKENSVIRYYADGMKMDIRIGSKDANTFVNPHYVSADSDNVYVCCNHNRVRAINKNDFSVTDVPNTYDDLQRYYRFGRFAVICTSTSAYVDKY